jgi:hemerythrin
MPRIEWNDSFLVGVELIDEQHKMLIERTNTLTEAIEKTRGLEKILQTLGFMIDYTEFHFSAEEEIMDKYAYPRMEKHQKLHEDFIIRLNQMVEEFEAEGATTALSQSICAFLNSWLINHIKEVDTELGKFLMHEGFKD